MWKAWDFTKNKHCHKHFDNNLQETLQTNILEMEIAESNYTYVRRVLITPLTRSNTSYQLNVSQSMSR